MSAPRRTPSRARDMSCAPAGCFRCRRRPARSLPRSAFTPGAKFRLWREPFVPPAPPDVEESIAAFVRRRLGTEFLDYAVDPFVAGIYAGDPERISVSAAFPRLHALEQKYGSLIKGQFQGARERRRAAGKAGQRGRKLLFPQRHADADRCARAGRDARHDRRRASGNSSVSSTAAGPSRARADGEPFVRRREERRACHPGV